MYSFLCRHILLVFVKEKQNYGRGEPLQKQINNDDENKSVCEGEGDKMCKWVELGERRVETKYEETLNRSLT